MKIDTKYLYELLPAYYRVIDEERGKPLEAFIALLAREGGIVEEDITQLYENWFIETCDEWVVPYIGDLLGVKGINEIEDATVYSRRAFIANTLSYRRRKGTAPVLEQIAFDITGWRSKAVEFFQLLSTTQFMNHIRLHNTVTPDMRQMNSLDLVNTAFDKQSHTVDVRRIEPVLGLHNIMNIGIYLWRLVSYPMEKTDARLIPSSTGIPDAAYTFSPLGLDSHLFNNPQTEEDIVHLAEEINVPGLLRRRALFDELEKVRQALVNGETPEYIYFDAGYPPVFQLYLNGSSTPVPFEEITICNLSGWRLPPISKDYEKLESDGSISIIPKAITAAVDPELGRITFADPASVAEVRVDYSYGFSGDLGGGPYDRKNSLEELEALTVDWHVGVIKDYSPTTGEPIHGSIWDAIDEWHSLPPDKKVGLITIMDSRTYEENLTSAFKIKIPVGKRLFIIAADWPEKLDDFGVPYRPVGRFNPEDLRPHILGDIEIEGEVATGMDGGGLLLNGLLVEGKITVLKDGGLSSLAIDHCTVVPYKDDDPAPHIRGIQIGEDQNELISLMLDRSICGPINILAEDAQISINESIIDNKEGMAVSVLRGQLAIQKTTVFGEVKSNSLDASNSIFIGMLTITRRQIGCVRFSYVPNGSETPRRYRCQPELEIRTQEKALKEKAATDGIPVNITELLAIKGTVLNWLFPVFNSSLYGHHAYAQLANMTPEQITTGADNGSEMGAFNYLQQPQRAANLKIVLKEYLRLGLEAGTIYVT